MNGNGAAEDKLEEGLPAAEEEEEEGLPHPEDEEENTNADPAEGRREHNMPSFAANKTDTLLVVATLITALSYQLGTTIPGGCWQDDGPGHVAGDPIMRDKHRRRYWLFMCASWAGFGSSMLLTVGLLTGVPPRSRLVLWLFVVAYSSLVLTFVTSQPRTSLAMDLGIWAAVMAVLAVVTKYWRLDRLTRWLVCDRPRVADDNFRVANGRRSSPAVIGKYQQERGGAAADTIVARLQRALLRARIVVEEAEGRHIANRAMLQQLRRQLCRATYAVDAFMWRDDRRSRVTVMMSRRSRSQTRLLLPPPSSAGDCSDDVLSVMVESLEAALSDMREFVVLLNGCPRVVSRQPYSAYLFMESCMFGRGSWRRSRSSPSCCRLSLVIIRIWTSSPSSALTRSLLVVDIDDAEESWRTFRSAVVARRRAHGGGKGINSKVIVISRTEVHASLLMGTVPPLRLHPPRREELWYFFKNLARKLIGVARNELPQVTMPELLVGGALSPAGETRFEMLVWESRIPPYVSYVATCDLERARQVVLAGQKRARKRWRDQHI
ncbi:hypothetical protein PR202_ga23873 [Eleusine coracana subsp. coracana]|uniref:PGG domain-containing protein n=1 Tax=Eleusine coracana subsp. coracana TaxID=191504 RepID=A0AAV5D7G4_ELECO|nr:hypothetical protein PR202_ga23873 [Eleusine coracana subsp. coracana]